MSDMTRFDQNISSEIKSKVNDFSITIASVNGSGSQTSNLTLLRAIFRMGIPVSGKNIFPSNIQGQPTWYTIRVNQEGHLARRAEHEIVVAMNPETSSKDVEDIIPGGVLFYSEDIEMPKKRTDIVMYPMPVKKLVREADVPAKIRNYIANMVYVGVLANLLGIDLEKIRMALEFHFKNNKSPVELNFNLCVNAYEWSERNLSKKDPYFLKPKDTTESLMLADGNTAAALGSIYGGVQFISWYPITPATSLAEALQTYLPLLREDEGKNTYAIVQAEDELAGIGMVVGAGWAGLRAMTTTSGPGLSLMAEFIGLAYFTEVPVVIWDVQRVGPSTGLPTRTAQGDILFANSIGHGDTQIVLLMPGSINECFEFGWRAFDIAEKFQTPVIVLSDLDFGMNQWMAKPFDYPDEPMDRGKILWEEDLDKIKNEWGRYRDLDKDYIPYRTLPGNKHPNAAYFARGTGHDEMADYSEAPDDWFELMQRLRNKYESTREYLPKPISQKIENAEIGIIAFGSTFSAVQEARSLLTSSGLDTNFLRIRAVPFRSEIGTFIQENRQNYVVEMNRDGQLHKLLIMEYPELASKMVSLAHLDGMPLTASQIYRGINNTEEITR
jgi:2-oxoglutarate ferredoxin oxidoreductase subunit alpha